MGAHFYTDAKNARDNNFKVNLRQGGEYEIYLVDNDHNGEMISTITNLELTMKPNTIVLIKEKYINRRCAVMRTAISAYKCKGRLYRKENKYAGKQHS